MRAQKIEAIIFDAGRVIVDFDHFRSAQQLARIAGLSPGRVWELFYRSGLGNKYERGDISTQQLADILRNDAVQKDFSEEQFIQAAGDMFKLKDDTAALIYELKAAGYPLYLLSNTCDAHWQVFKNYPVFKDCFKGLTLSFEVRAVKPEAKIYQHAIAQTGKHASACIYTDDVRDYVQAARGQGMQAVHFKNAAQFRAELIKAGLSL